MARHAHGTLTQAKHAADLGLLCLASPSCQPRERSSAFPCPRALPPASHSALQTRSNSTKKPKMQCPIGPERGGSSLGTNRSHWKLWVPGRFALCFLPPSHDSPKLKLLWSSCSHFTMKGPQQHPGPQSPDPSTEELIPTLSSALEPSLISHRPQRSPSSSPAQPSLWQQGARYPKEPAPVQAPWLCSCPGYLGAEALAAGGLELSQAQRAEGNNPGGRRGMALDSRDSRRGCAVLTEGMAKASSPSRS